MSPDFEKIRLRMADLCARSEQCEYDLRIKLARTRITASECNAIIAFLREGKFIDEQRFAMAFTNDKVRFSAWGRLKIRMALKAKRISDSAIAEAAEAIDADDYTDALMRTARAKASSLDLDDFNDRRRLMRHILSRGFEPSLASKAIKSLNSDD